MRVLVVFSHGTYLVQVADLRGHAVYKVTGTRLIESGTSPSKDDPKCGSCLPNPQRFMAV